MASIAGYGPWAVVTGASSGIGEELARQVAGEGLNVVLVARRVERLEDLASELEGRGVETRVVGADLATPEGLEKVKAGTADLDVGLVIPNAGVEHHGSFLHRSEEESRALVDLNVVAPLVLARHFGQAMVERGRGGILFVGSVVAYSPVPYFANYAASKAYVLALGEALSYELGQEGVDVAVLSPGLTDTAMIAGTDGDIDWSRTPFSLMPIGPVARTGLAALGSRPSAIPGLRNRFAIFAGKYLTPRGLGLRIFGSIMRRAVREDLVAPPEVRAIRVAA